MDIKVTDLRKFLKEEFGIKNDEEFEMAINTSIGVDLGLFTQLYKDVIKEERTWWIEECYIQRKGFYIGGEWLIVPIVLIAIHIVPSVIKEIINASKENDNDSKRIKWFY